jgi:hypothetical protein
MKCKRVFFFLAVSLFLLLFGRVRIAPPDLAFYYSFAHSLVYDLDFCFANQFSHFPFAYHETYLTPQGYPANDWPMGTGICWTPFLLFARLALFVGTFMGMAIESNGYGWFEMWIVTLGSSIVFGAGALYLSYRYCIMEGLSKSSARWATALIGVGSSFTYHLYVNSADSHPPSAFFTILFLILWQTQRKNPTTKNAFLIGFTLGMAALIRPHNLILISIPLIEFLTTRIRSDSQSGKRLITLGAMAAGAIITFFPQLLVWKELYGAWFAAPRSEEVVWHHPELYNMLFSDFHGMISWSPLFGLGMLGLFIQKRYWHFTVPILLQIYVYACNVAWWAGGSFGNRRMLGCTPFFILGLAVLLDAVPKMWLKCLAGVAGIWTLSLLIAEVGGHIQLDHYQPWAEMLTAVHAGFLPGVFAHFTKPEWLDHGMASMAGYILTLVFLTLLFLVIRFFRSKNHLFFISALSLGIVIFNVFSILAIYRTSAALETSDVSQYLPYDRFTWVIYYEHGYYLYKNDRIEDALEQFLAAAVIEPRHSQPWMYASFFYELHGWNHLAYYFSYYAMINGQRTPEFFELFDRALTHMILLNDHRIHLYYNERGVVRALGGNPNAAEDDFRMSLHMKPDYDPASENLQVLDTIRKGQKARFQWE